MKFAWEKHFVCPLLYLYVLDFTSAFLLSIALHWPYHRHTKCQCFHSKKRTSGGSLMFLASTWRLKHIKAKPTSRKALTETCPTSSGQTLPPVRAPAWLWTAALGLWQCRIRERSSGAFWRQRCRPSHCLDANSTRCFCIPGVTWALSLKWKS